MKEWRSAELLYLIGVAFVCALVFLAAIVVARELWAGGETTNWFAVPGFPHCPDELIISTVEGYECASYSIIPGTPSALRQ